MKKNHRFFFVLAFTLLASATFAQKELTDKQILDLYKELRVADVSDGMDMAGLKDAGLMDQRIQALWKDIDSFKHQFRGIAVTARYVPTNRYVPNNLTPEQFSKWEGNWYNKISPETFVGSNNSLAWVQKGAIGIVSAGGIRDNDEITKEKIPVYLDPLQRGRGIRPGRNELESVNKPVVVGGV